MSLINDALKRAEAAQGKAEQSGGPDLKFRPPDENEPTQNRFGGMWPWIVTAAAVAAVLFIWQLNHRGKGQQPAEKSAPATANERRPADASGNGSRFLSSNTLKVHAREQEAGGATVAAAAPVTAPNTAGTEKVAVVALSGTTLVETTPTDKRAGTNSTAAGENVSVRPAGPKLQAIIFNPANPSAIINGKTVFVGEKVGELRVVWIGKDSARVVSGGETNVLKLGQ